MQPPREYKDIQNLTGCLAALSRFISSSPKLLSQPEQRKILQLYLAESEGAVSSVLIHEDERQQKPVYYVSRVLHGTKENYPVIDKFVFTMVVSAHKLKIYFESHPIQVVTDQPMKRVITIPQLSERLTTWAIELIEFDISYVPRTSIKAQALADFVIECTTKNPSSR
ncbi:hypothetical protein LIER_02221 [Lithospermum erythrorhizon]|uniref:Reverse transcriptase RNase H-like domain-containing protein n=1 Tax=Lithospermum erythrorhizon TaxID=34254 RepID=A0AAV3NT81_LITER